MRKMKKINGYLVVKFNARELREYEGTALGEYGVIDAELYTGILDIDRGAMEYDNAGSMDKPFWADSCPVKSCCEKKGLQHCGECDGFVCPLLHTFAYDMEQSDNGARIEQCQKWCNNNGIQ